jgi:ABC-type transport system involved in cytochrome c biogenesis permease subunit
MKLVDDVKFAWRWFSTWLIAASGGLLTAYETFPQLQAYIPEKWFHMVMGVMLVLIFIGRIVKQNPTAQGNP